LRTTPLRRSMTAIPSGKRSGVQSRRGKPLGRARSSGDDEFARSVNFHGHEALRSSCEPSRRLDAVQRRWRLWARIPGQSSRLADSDRPCDPDTRGKRVPLATGPEVGP
jgi:hypothetical protein